MSWQGVAMVLRRIYASIGLAVSLTLGALFVPASALGSGSEWTPPRPIPGTDGLWAPASATARDGTDIVLWYENGPSGLQNQLGRSSGWRVAELGSTCRPGYTNIFTFGDVVADSQGDFWVVYTVWSGRVFVARLDCSRLRWARPVEIFTDLPGYYYNGFRLGAGRDGELAVLSYAEPIVRSQDGFDTRAAVATKATRHPWTSQFLNPEGTAAYPSDLSVNALGDVAVSFVQGLEDPQHATVRVAIKSLGHAGAWRVDTVSSPERVVAARTSVGADGSAYVIWTSGPPFQSEADTVSISSVQSRDPGATWTSRDVVTGKTIDADGFPVVAGRAGDATAIWHQVDSWTSGPLYTRHFDNSTDPGGAQVQLTNSEEFGVYMDAVERPDGRILMLTRRETVLHTDLSLDMRTISAGHAGLPTRLTPDLVVHSSYGYAQISVDAAGRGQLVYGDHDGERQQFTWQGQVTKPSAISRRTGDQVSESTVIGHPRLGARLRCQSGFLG